MKRILTFFLAAAIAGCATGPLDNTGTFLPPLHYQSLESAKICCDSHKTIRYVHLQRGTEVKTTVLPDTPVFEFNGRRSFFAAFELPPGESRILMVTTTPVNMLLNRYGHVMVPSVEFLGGDFNPIATIEPRYETDSLSPAKAHVRVPDTALYAVLFDGRNAGGLAWRDHDQASGSLFVRSGPTGEISVLLSGPVAMLSDSGFSEDGTKAQLFSLMEVDGNSVQSSFGASASASHGRGFALTTRIVSRPVPVKPMKVKLKGAHTTGAPIQAIFSQISGDFFSVEGVVDFDPAPGGDYVVKGILKKEGSLVWIEDARTNQPVTQKIGKK